MRTERGSRSRLAVALWLPVAVLAVGVAGLALARVWPLLHPPVAERAALARGCDLLAEPCEVAFADGGRVRLHIRPHGIPVVHPLQVEVTLSGLPSPRRLELDLAGVDMDMGYNRVVLRAGASRGEWLGETMLPVCVRARMTWEAQVLLHTDEGIRSAPFRFDAVRVGQAQTTK